MFFVPQMSVPLVLFLVLTAAACGRAAGGGDAGATCPTKLNANSAEWTHTGNDPECAELADSLNAGAGDDLLSDSGGCRGAFEMDERACVATLQTECDGTGLAMQCAVRSSGTADCAAVVTSDELAARSCAFELLIN